MESLLQSLGQEALRSLPLALGVWVCIALALGYGAYHTLTTDIEPRHVLPAGIFFAVIILVWVGVGLQTYDEMKALCRDMRGTSQWSEQKCRSIDPEGQRLEVPGFSSTAQATGRA